jgi:hypothetical protein
MSNPNVFPDAFFPFEYWVIEYWPVSSFIVAGVHGCVDLNDILYNDITIEDALVNMATFLTDELLYSEVIIVDELVNMATMLDSAYYDTLMEDIVCPG